MDDLAMDVSGLQIRLLEWFKRNGRRFPWRETVDPYAVLLAEKLLQQTAVGQRVVQVYEKLLHEYPNAMALANAKPEDISVVIEPLGLHYRAHELVILARQVVSHHGGRMPCDLRSLVALRGVGDYGARAVLCFAFGVGVPVVDTNVARILHRLFGLRGPLPANPARKKSLRALAGSLLPEGLSREFNLALLDLGAMVCRPSVPRCQTCPLLEYCQFGRCSAIKESEDDR